MTNYGMGKALGIFMALIGVTFAGLGVAAVVNDEPWVRWALCCAGFCFSGFMVYLYALTYYWEDEEE